MLETPGAVRSARSWRRPETRTATGSSPDADADGVLDFLVGKSQQFRFPQIGKGEVRVVSSAMGATLLSVHGSEREALGQRVVCIGDVDGDSVDDIAAVSYFWNRILSGATGSTLTILPLTDTRHLETFAPIGDWNGDGLEDFVRGAPGSDRQHQIHTGRVEIRSGNDLFLWVAPAFVSANSTVEFHVRAGEAGELAALFVEAIDGVPVRELVWIGRLNAQGEADLSQTVPPEVSGRFDLRAYSMEK